MTTSSWARRAAARPEATDTTPSDADDGVGTAIAPAADLPELLATLPTIDDDDSVDAVEERLFGFAAGAASALVGRSPAERKEFRDHAFDRLAPVIAESALMRAVRGRRDSGSRSSEALVRALGNQPEGDDNAVMGFERFLLGSTPLSALRARSIFMARELDFRFRQHDGETFSVLALGAGPRCEAIDLLRDLGPDADAVQVTLVDGDRRNLDAAVETVERDNLGGSLRCLHIDPIRLTLSDKELVGRQDFIFSNGLLEYLPDPLAVGCLDYAFGRLRGGGELLFAHYHHDLGDADRLVLEWWLQWFPYFRDSKQIARLVRKTSIPGSGHLAGMSRGPNFYVVVQRPR